MDSGRETAYDPSRHGPMAEDRGYANQAAVPQRVDPRISRGPQPSFLRELGTLLEEMQSQANEIAGRIHNNADSVLGPQPEPGASNGANKPLPPPSGQVHQLIDQARTLNNTLRECRAQLDRFDAL